jgi:predicted MPP superfamily phosphohydrolase
MSQRFTRRYFLRLLLGSTATVGLSALGGAGYSTLVEPYWLTLRRVDIPIPDLPPELNGYTIVQLSDLHRGSVITQQAISRAVEVVLREGPALVVLTGDYVSQSAEYATSCAEALSPLISSGSPIACLGNHDHWTDAKVVTQALSDTGITVLRNGAQEVADRLWVAAVDDVWEQHADLDKALSAIPAGATVVLLAHEPDYADEVLAADDVRIRLQLSGHSHGGQVNLPLIGPPVRPYLARKYHTGRYRLGHMWLYVNRGIGLIRPAVRLNCRPEVTALTLRAAGSL